jgi:hypothetical protein
MENRGRYLVAVLAGALLLLPASAGAHTGSGFQVASPSPSTSFGPASCPGAPINPTHVVTGQFDASLQGSFVDLPFDVPAGTTAVRVKYCYDPPIGPFTKHTLDLGLYQPRPDPAKPWGTSEFRGWGGSSHPDVIVSPEGFSTEAQYRLDPRGNAPGKTTRGFLPGPIPTGQWAVELGVAAVITPDLGDADGKVGWRVEIELSDDPANADEPYQPAPYDQRAANSAPGWYAGDFHVHAEHSALGDATMTDTFDFAFRPIDAGGAGLDFITLDDYVAGSAWGEIGRYQPAYPGKLIARGDEVITYHGHTNNQVSARYVDYRTGPIYERRDDGTLALVRGPRPPRELFDDVHAGGGFTQINHPTIFPSSVAFFAQLCRGCPWDYSDSETDYSKVDAIEVSTGPPPPLNTFTADAIAFWEHALDLGYKIAAVGSSDSHHAGQAAGGLTPQAPIGIATTVVRADQLSEQGIKRAVQSGHTYVKLTGNAGPDVRLTATTARRRAPAIFGDTVRGNGASFVARVIGGISRTLPSNGPVQLLIVKDGVPIQAATVSSDDFTLPFTVSEHGRYRLQVQQGPFLEVVSSPIYFEPLPTRPGKGCGDKNHQHERAGECK